MIYLTSNAINTVTLTLQENSAIYSLSAMQPYYLFELTNESTNQVIYMVADNISPTSARTRYDQFLVTLTGATYQNLTGGTLNMPNGIWWQYVAYEQYNRNNLNPSLAYNIVEVGKVFVDNTHISPIVSYTSNDNKQYISYNN